MKKMPLSKGKSALVSDEDYDYLNQWKWCVNGGGYATRSYRADGRKRYWRMHRIVVERTMDGPIPEGLFPDHIDGDRLNNQRENLRLVTSSQNSMGRKSRAGSASQYKGVFLCVPTRHWEAIIGVAGQKIYLGTFSLETDAARAYDKAAREHFGEYARLNFPDE